MKIKDMNKNELPRERLLSVGATNLSNEELLSIILKTGTKNINVKELSSRVLSEYKTINNLKNASINSLIKINGIGKVKATELLATLELGKRVFIEDKKDNIKLNKPSIIFEYFKDKVYFEKQEVFYCVCLDSKSKLISYKELFRGTLNMTMAHPREVFKQALIESAACIIVIHNHPSNDTTPSKADIEFTNHLFEAGEIIGIPVVDHIIIGKDNYYSFYNNMHNNI